MLPAFSCSCGLRRRLQLTFGQMCVVILAFLVALCSLVQVTTGQPDDDGFEQRFPIQCVPTPWTGTCECFDRESGGTVFRCAQRNNVTSIPVPFPMNTTGIEIVHTRVFRVEANVLNSYVDLTTIDLSSNNISYVAPGAFRNLINLRTLKLTVNPQLTSLDVTLFKGLVNLEVINLDHCGLTSLPQCIFQGLPKLTYLGLDYNHITPLPNGIFAHLPSLLHVRLAGNNFSSLQPQVFNTLPNFTSIEITSLPSFMCDCSSLWLRQSAQTIHLTATFNMPLCTAPSQVSGLSFDTVTTGSVCPQRTPAVQPTVQRATRGQNVIFTCDCYTTSPEPIYVWNIDGRSLNTAQGSKYTEFRSMLIIKNVSDDDAGMLQCSVVDPGLAKTYVASTKAQLIVTGDPFCDHPVPPSPNDGSGSSSSDAVWAGVGVGAGAAVILTIVAVVIAWKQCRASKSKLQPGMVPPVTQLKKSQRLPSAEQNLPANMEVNPDDDDPMRETAGYMNYVAQKKSKKTSQKSFNDAPFRALNEGDPDLTTVSHAVGGHTLTGMQAQHGSVDIKVAQLGGLIEGGPDFSRFTENPLAKLGSGQGDRG